MNQSKDLNRQDFAQKGMQDLVVDTTSVSFVDAKNGKLFYRGIDIAELATHATFEETAWLLLCAKLPSKSALNVFQWSLRSSSKLQEKIIRIIEELPKNSHPLYVLQVCLSALSCINRMDDYLENEENIENVIQIIAQTPAILSAAYRHNLGVPLLEPRDDLSFCENFIYNIFGYIPSKLHTHCIESALIIQMDHGFNTSTFVARAVASTLTNFYSSVSAAVGALSGPLHGGASERVFDMIEEAKHFGDIRSYTRTLLENKGRIMGMGHRLYKTVDPRALIFKDLLVTLTKKNESQSDLEILTIIHDEAREFFKKQNKDVFVNVDFWSGAVYKKLGILPILYPAIFAVARVVGWCAHILELRQDNHLYRPRSLYVGKLNVPYIPIDQRE